MKQLFQTQNRQGTLVQINIFEPGIKDKLWKWLENEHNEIFWDIEMHEGGSIIIQRDVRKLNSSITFMGDNGIFELEQVAAETI